MTKAGVSRLGSAHKGERRADSLDYLSPRNDLMNSFKSNQKGKILNNTQKKSSNGSVKSRYKLSLSPQKDTKGSKDHSPGLQGTSTFKNSAFRTITDHQDEMVIVCDDSNEDIKEVRVSRHNAKKLQKQNTRYFIDKNRSIHITNEKAKKLNPAEKA